jgi:hypothetical protein
MSKIKPQKQHSSFFFNLKEEIIKMQKFITPKKKKTLVIG